MIVHRQLMAALAASNDPTSAEAQPPLSGLRPGRARPEPLSEMATRINERNRAAKIAQRESLELFQVLYFSSMGDGNASRTVDALITKVKENGFIAHAPRYVSQTCSQRARY